MTTVNIQFYTTENLPQRFRDIATYQKVKFKPGLVIVKTKQERAMKPLTYEFLNMKGSVKEIHDFTQDLLKEDGITDDMIRRVWGS